MGRTTSITIFLPLVAARYRWLTRVAALALLDQEKSSWKSMRSHLRLEMEPTEAGKQLLTTENTDPHGNSILMLPKNFGHRPLALVWIERGAVRHFSVFRVFRG